MASFESYEYLSKGNACFIKIQSLTTHSKQTRQVHVIKIPQHGFLDQGVKKT